MAELVYDKDGRLLFTQEMKREYTLLMPQMLPVHFGMFQKMLQMEGYKVDMLMTRHHAIVEEGQKYVHNDTCYPALLVIGQLIDAVKNGGYDPHKVALLITQTGGGCRASNYIHLLRKALHKAGYDYIPVISVSFGVEKNPGFKLSLSLIRKLAYAMLYGDVIVNLANQVRPYEVNAGAADAMTERWENELVESFGKGRRMRFPQFVKTIKEIVADFESIPVRQEEKIKVGIVGEIYVKFSPLGNNNLEQFLLSEGCEVIVPGLTDFIIFKIFNRITDIELYGGSKAKYVACKALMEYVVRRQNVMIDIIGKSRFRAPTHFEEIHKSVHEYLGDGNKMGEGWLLTGEMLELIHDGVPNIVCTQPFGCLPNHIVGKGMIRPLKDDYPDSNIVAIDYDPSATAINQENRIKLMLANARQKMKRQRAASAAAQQEETKAAETVR